MQSPLTTHHSESFKGIALFTPGGDLIYCVDHNKQSRWHLHLCSALQQLLRLPEPPHFLVSCYAATVDRWLDPQTGQRQLVAEAAPTVLKHQALLNVVFGLEDVVWQTATCRDSICDPIVLATYRNQFPQLWETHDLVVQYEQGSPLVGTNYRIEQLESGFSGTPYPDTRGYVLRLFVSGHNAATERALQNLHHLLEQFLGQPYTLKVIDVLQNPDQAELDQVSATPTLVKAWPRPVRRVVGDLDNVDQLVRLLGGIEEEF